MSKLTVNDIIPGLRLEQPPGSFWKVARLINFPGEKIPHVQVVNERDPSRVKTVSINAVLDSSLFRRAG
ncbi:MAG: hypothetical protein KIT20_07880 [Alphaproteobacteria bacterium]|nr:hypothetical protein [Alphaproteobacteria bacterium]